MGKSGSVFCGVTAPFSWVLVGMRFYCILQESVSQVLWKFCNQIPLAFKFKFPGGSQSFCPNPRLGNLLWALELLQQHEKLLCYDCSPVCGLSAWLICGWSHGDLLQEDFCHLPHLPGLQSEPLSLRWVAADLGFHRRPSHTQRQVWLSLLCVCGGSLLLSLHSPAHRVLFAPSQRLWRVGDLIVNVSEKDLFSSTVAC